MKIIIGEVIKSLRKEKGISQETLASEMGVSIQAVSKWECDNSYPDIALLPSISGYFGVPIEFLFYGKKTDIQSAETDKKSVEFDNTMPDDNVLRIVQFKGKHVLSKNEYNPEIRIMLETDSNKLNENKMIINIEVWGSADIKGNINGEVHAGDYINCGNVVGGVEAGDCVNCGNVVGGVEAGDAVNCGNIAGGVNAGDGINCGNIGGNINCGDSLNCGDIDGDIISCDGDIRCNNISGNVRCDGDIIYENK